MLAKQVLKNAGSYSLVFTVLFLCRATKVPCYAFDAKQSSITFDEGKDGLYILKSYAWKRHK